MNLFNNSGKDLKSKKQRVIEENREFYDLREKANFEKGDLLALIIAALTTLLPVVLVLLFLYYAISMLIFG